MEITYVKRKDLHVDKYDACIEQSIQSRIYAFSWYLDIVADHWDVLVYDDYKAVMPIPWRIKYGIKYVAQPPFCQQLGIFSKEEIKEDEEFNFLKILKKKFFKILYQFNASNFKNSQVSTRINYVLALDKDYKSLFSNFSKGRKHAVKKAVKNQLNISSVLWTDLIKIQKENYNYKGFEEAVLSALAKEIIERKKGLFKGVYKDNELLGGAFFIKTRHRIVYLFSTFTKQGRDLQASSFLIDSIIKENHNQKVILDFEGGNIPSIGKFFKSFGTTNKPFYQFDKKLRLFKS